MKTINDLKSALGSGASPSKFVVNIPVPLALKATAFGSKLLSKIPFVKSFVSGPTKTPDADTIKVLAKASSLPEKTVGTVDVYSKGVKYVIRGVSEFPNRWDVTFYNTADLALRRFFEEWMFQIDNGFDSKGSTTVFPNNYFGTSSINSGYMVNMNVSQLCQNGDPVAGYKLHYAFPVTVSAVALDASITNTVSEFTVTFAYSYWTAVNANENEVVSIAKDLWNTFF